MRNTAANTFNRHDLMWLKLDAVKHAEYTGPAAMEPISALSLLHRWVLCDYPLIVARQAEVPAGQVRVGLAEPASWGKRRLSFLVNVEDIARHQQGPLLADILSKLPCAWKTGAVALIAALRELNVPAHVYGSSAIEALTGLPCITANSDLDVLFKPANWVATQALCHCLDKLRLQCPEFKVDGEVLNPQGVAVNWQELSQQPAQLLVKTNEEVRLIEFNEYQQAFSRCVQGAA